jgi:hypothetical protein
MLADADSGLFGVAGKNICNRDLSAYIAVEKNASTVYTSNLLYTTYIVLYYSWGIVVPQYMGTQIPNPAIDTEF